MFNSALRDRIAPGFVLRLALGMLFGFGNTFCSTPIPAESSVLASEAADVSRNVMKQANQSIAFFEDDDGPMVTLMQGLSLVEEMFADAMPMPQLLQADPPAAANSTVASAQAADPELSETLETLSAGFPVWLRDRLLAPQNLVGEANGVATYRLQPDPTCRPLKLPGEAEPAVIAACGKALAQVPVWVTLAASEKAFEREVGGTMSFAAGDSKAVFATLEIRFDHIDLQLDFSGKPQAVSAMNVLATALLPGIGKLDSLSGSVNAVLAKQGTTGSSLTVSIKEKLELVYLSAAAANSADPRPSHSFTLAAASPLLTVTSDGAAKELTLQLDMGATDIQVPLHATQGGATVEQLNARLLGFRAGLQLTAVKRSLRLVGLKILDYSERVGGKETLRMSVNEAMNQSLDAELVIASDGLPHISLIPGLFMAAVYELPGAQATKDEFSLELDGKGDRARLSAVTRNGSFAGFAMLAGQLRLSSASGASDLEVTPGNCLGRKSYVEANEHPLLGHLAVGPCPRP